VTYLWIIIAIVVVAAIGLTLYFVPRRGRGAVPPVTPPTGETRPGAADEAEERRDTSGSSVGTLAPAPPGPVTTPPVEGPEVLLPSAEPVPELETPEPTAGRMQRLRARLARSQNVFGRGLLSVLSREHLDEEAWEEVEDALLSADVGVGATAEIVDQLRDRTKVLGTRSTGELRALLADELVAAIRPDMDRSLRTLPHNGHPAVLLVVGVNGTGKTTTCGKLARVLVADGRTVLLGAADTFRAAAADQLQTWGSRVGAETVRGPEGSDPASVAFDAVKQGTDRAVDTVVIDTAGRLHTKVGLMDELGKVKRVVERQGPVDETLLVLDATTGQNGMIQARVFTEIVDVTGIVLTKLDGTAKGGIVISVQRELNVPVKLVGLGEGADDLAPFDPEEFVDALLGDTV
jgi:fused signal recognition particle receptor